MVIAYVVDPHMLTRLVAFGTVALNPYLQFRI
jgi:hypothetical protein